jgi:hypothetical protein
MPIEQILNLRFPAIAVAAHCAISSPMASDEDLKAEIERLRAENEALKKTCKRADVAQGEREGWAFGLRAGAIPGHPVP